MKQCSKCGELKPLDAFRLRHDRPQQPCKVCTNTLAVGQRRAQRVTLTCRDCGATWQIQAVNRNGQRDGRCRSCVAKAQAAQEHEMRSARLKSYRGRLNPYTATWRENRPRGAQSPVWKGGKPNCSTCGKQIDHYSKRCMACENAARVGQRIGPDSSTWRGGLPRCIDCGDLLTRRGLTRCYPCAMKHNSGPNNPQWRGGVTPEYEQARKSTQYARWRAAVYDRDNYTCQLCGQRGGNLQADHILPFADFPELRFDVSNGRALCEPCHRQTPTYGGKAVRTIRSAVAFFSAHPLTITR